MNPACKILANCVAAAILLIARQVLAADEPKKEARVTQIIRDVELLLSKATPRPAAVEDKVREDTAVQTGIDSRAELTFADLTITRLGETTIFSFNAASRDFELSNGSILLWVSKNSGAARIRARAVTVGLTGTTVIFQSSPAGHSRLVVLEGSARLSLNKYPSESADIMGGQMLDVDAGATRLPPRIDVDLSLLMKTAPLITDFPPLPSQDLILSTSQHPGKLVNVPTAPASPSRPFTVLDLGRNPRSYVDVYYDRNKVALITDFPPLPNLFVAWTERYVEGQTTGESPSPAPIPGLPIVTAYGNANESDLGRELRRWEPAELGGTRPTGTSVRTINVPKLPWSGMVGCDALPVFTTRQIPRTPDE